MTVGTVAYTAPEQLKGEEVDGRADLYSLAATAYQMLTGSTLFPRSSPAAVIGAHLSAEPLRSLKLDPNSPRWTRFWPWGWPRIPRIASSVVPTSRTL